MMERINTIWQQLESSYTEGSGLLKTRYSHEVAAELYLGLLAPAHQRCFILKVNFRDVRTLQVDKNLKGLKIVKLTDPQHSDSVLLSLVLLNQHAQEIFDILIQDIINKVSSLSEERQILKIFLTRVEAWRMLFDKDETEFLSGEAQQGLYGELYFLRKWILNYNEEKGNSIAAWLGVENDLRDFQIGDKAIEVKTTRGNSHQKISINSERQLDTTKLSELWLFHISLEVQQQNGESLNQIVDSIIELLKDDLFAVTEFKSKLLRAKYFVAHRPFYDIRGYQIRQETFYTVRDEFPRIEESMIPRGVGDVKYTIILSDYSSYITNENLIFEKIGYGKRNQ